MAGKKSKRQYTDDAGSNYKVTLDTSNSEGTIGNAALPLLDVSAPADGNLPAGLKLRYVQATLATDPLVRRRFYVGDPDLVDSVYAPGAIITAAVFPVGGGAEGTAVAWNITSYRGERRRLG